MTNQSDLVLIKRCLDGEVNAFAGLIDRYQKPVYNAAFRMLSDARNAEDVTQTVFIKAFENLDRYDANYKFFSWVYKMTINESINFLKRENRFAGLDLNTLSNQNASEDAFHQFETKEQIDLALLVLEPSHRAIVVLKHFHGLSYKEIGYIMDSPEKTIKSRLYESRQQMRKVFFKQGYVQ